MVNGKPQLTFGGGQVAAPARTPRRASLPAGSRVGTDFASFLPLAQNSRQETGQVSGAPATRAAHMPMQSQLLSQATAWAGGASHAGEHAPSGSAANMPAGSRNLASARSSLAGRMATSQIQHSPAKSAPRISGQPVTGRSDIGMIDTRPGARSRMALAESGTAGPAAPSARATQAPPSAILRPGTRHPVDSFTDFGSRYENPLMRSFITQGFASKSAESALKNLGYDLRNRSAQVQTRASLLAPASTDERARTAVQTASHRKKDMTLSEGSYSQRSLVPTFYSMADTGLGSLAAKFESGSEGIAAIGYDRTGGTSYGKYQISSRAGTMSRFIDYLRDQAPDLAKRLAAAGPANTSGKSGRMPGVWREIASENPQRFESLQNDFIRTSHFEPAREGIAEATGVGFGTMHMALQEVLFSTAVQHGPAGAVRIISRALDRVDKDTLRNTGRKITGNALQAGKQLIQQIYALRAGQFASSTARVQSAVRNRLRVEMQEALEMLS